MDEIKYTFDGKFEENKMIVGRTKYGKTTFVQNLGKNKLFGDTSTVFWISKISLSEEREEKIRESFEDRMNDASFRQGLMMLVLGKS